MSVSKRPDYCPRRFLIHKPTAEVATVFRLDYELAKTNNREPISQELKSPCGHIIIRIKLPMLPIFTFK